MSYDLFMFAPEPGVDPMDTLERLDEEIEAASPDRALVERSRRIADALQASNPAYETSQLDFVALAERQGISVDEARWEHRDLQLMAAGGLEIGLSDNQASITFPYWDSLDADSLAVAIGEAARVISQQTGWRLYDPQLGRFIDPGADAQAFRSAFDHGRDSLRRIVAEQEAVAAAPPKQRLWKRLLRRD